MAATTPSRRRVFLRSLDLLILLSAAGLVVSLVLHASRLVDFDSKICRAVLGADFIHAALLLVFLPLIFILHKHRVDFGYRNVERMALQRCPPRRPAG